MLENKIIEILSRILDPYIDGLDPTKLSLSNLLSGKVILNNLNLKPTLIDLLELPFHLTFGSIGTMSLKVHIPILSLSKKKFSIEINDVVFLLTAIPESQWNYEAYRDAYIASKIAMLASESLQLVVNEIQGSGFLWSVLLSFMETLEITMTNIHIRLEDLTTNPNFSYAFGVDIKRAFFHTNVRKIQVGHKVKGVQTVALPFQSLFYSDHDKLSPGIIYRTIDLEGLGLYIDQLDKLSPSMLNYSKEKDKPFGPVKFKSGDLISEDDGNHSIDELNFMDAISYNANDSKIFKRDIVNQHTDFLKRDERDRPSLRRSVYKLRFNKNRRLSHTGSLSYKGMPMYMDRISSYPREEVHAIEHTNTYHLSIFSRIFEFLTNDQHKDNCENALSDFNVWARHNYANHYDVKTRRERSSGLFKSKSDVRSRLRQSHSFNMYKRSKRRINLNRDNYKPNRSKANSFNTTPMSGNNLFVQDWKSPVTFKMWANDSAHEPIYATNTIERNLGYSFSPSSSWRIFLGTFCTVHRPITSNFNQASDIIDKSINRSKQRRMRNETQHNYNVDHTQDPAPQIQSRTKSLKTTRRCPNIIDNCLNVDIDLNDSEYDDIDPDEYTKNARLLQYGDDWHIHNKLNADEDVNDAEEDESDLSPLYSSKRCDTDNIAVNESWTRFSFVANNDNLEMLEFFIKTLDEIDHNYLIAPRDFNGIASFYFCSYPILPARPFKSCWSPWGEKYGRAVSDSKKAYLPKCSVVLVLEDTDIIITKNQLDCLINLIYENIYKYYYWISGVISIFENARATPEDEKMYMEYWPQYVLLSNNTKKLELRDFVSDFEILHSIQVVRILRNKASFALRNLISRIGKDYTHCLGTDLNTCVTDALFTNIFEMYCENESALELTEEGSTVLQDRLHFVGGIYEIVSQQANSGILTSLRKICEQETFTIDMVFDFFVFNSHCILTDRMNMPSSSNSNVLGYMASVHGFHFLVQDTYGRDGTQIMEIEFLPFTITSLSFSVNPCSKLFSNMSCPCKLLNSSPSILLSCGGVSTIQSRYDKGSKRRALLNMIRKDKNKITNESHSNLESTTVISTDSVMYISLDYTHYSVPGRSDVYIRFHLASELFVHFRIIDELDRLLQVFKYNLKKFSTISPIYMSTDKKKDLHVMKGSFNDMRLIYELIDLGVEFQKVIIQDTATSYSYNVLIQTDSPILILLDLYLRSTSFPYYISLGRILMNYDNPTTQDDSHYDSHTIKISDVHCYTNSGVVQMQNKVMNMYMGTHSYIPLNRYLNNISKDDVYTIDSTFTAILNKFDKKVDIIKMGEDTEVTVKVKILKSSAQRDIENTIFSISLGSLYLTLRDVDLISIICTYANFMEIFNEYSAFVSLYNRDLRSSYKKPIISKTSTTYTMCDSGMSPDDSFSKDYHSAITYRWNKLQTQLLEQRLCRNTNAKFEFHMDYLCFNLRKLVELCDTRVKSNYRHSSILIRTQSTNSTIQQYSSPAKSKYYTGIQTMHATPSIRRDDSGCTNSSSGNPDSRKNSTFYNSSDSDEPRIRTLSPDDLYVLGSAFKFYGITTPLASIKLMGIGLKLGITDRGVRKLRLYLGCLEIEDQSNSVPLYLSTILCGGNSTMLWRWLKVKRELNYIRRNSQEFKNVIMNFKRGIKSYESRMVSKKLCHVDLLNTELSAIDGNCAFYESSIVCGYKIVKSCLDTVMDYSSVVNNSITIASNFPAKSPCFITLFLDSDDYGAKDSVIYISNTFLNVCWEIADEFIYYLLRVFKYANYIPEVVEPPILYEKTALGVDVDSEFKLSVHVCKSNVNILSDSAWYGYTNFLRYMWYKALREYNIIDVSFSNDTNKASILDSESIRGLNYSFNRRTESVRNIHSRIVPMDSDLNQLDRKLDTLSPTKSSFDLRFCVSALWSFIRSIYNETYTRAYMTYPTAMRISGVCSLYFTYNFCPSVISESCIRFIQPQYKHMTNVESKLVDANVINYLSDYMPCTIQFRAICRNISVKLSRDACSPILSPYGYTHQDFVINSTKEFKQRHSEFNKFIHLQKLHDKKYYGLLELSKGTLYDTSNMLPSKIVEPFRFTFTTTLYLYGTDPSAWNFKAVPQSVSSRLKLEPINISLNCVDLIYCIDLVGVLTKCIEFVMNECVDYSHVNETTSYTFNDNTPTNSNKDLIGNDEEFHSCSSDETDVDWASVSSNESPDGFEILERGRAELNKDYVTQKIDDNSGAMLDSLMFFLSLLSVGFEISIELINVELCTSHSVDIRHMFVATIEDVQFCFWMNNIHEYLENPERFKTDDVKYTPLQMFELKKKISVCEIALKKLLYTDVNDDEYIECDGSSDGDGRRNCTDMGMIQFYCNYEITFDLCRGSNREMALETVRVTFEGFKPTLFFKMSTNFNVSWININMTLDAADCYHNFLCFFMDMVLLRNVLLDNAYSDFLAIQPVTICGLYDQVKTTMVPVNFFSSHIQTHFRASYPYNLSINQINNSNDMLQSLEYRFLNYLFSRRNALNIHGTMLSQIRTIISWKVDTRQKSDSFDGYDMLKGDAANRDQGVESVKERYSHLYNNLGQPIAVCTNIDLANYELNWKVLSDGESYILPSGHYGIISPFVVRIQLNSYIFEIPSSSLNISQNDEVMFKLDMSQKYYKSKNKSKFLKLRNSESKLPLHKFGFNALRVEKLFDRGNKNDMRYPFKRANKKYSIVKTKLRMSLIDSQKDKKDIYRFAYIIVRTVQHLGVQSATSGGPQSAVNIYLSSPLWLINKTRENAVIFPSLKQNDKNTRMIEYSSLVWMDLPSPPTYTLPLSPKSTSNKVTVVKEYMTNMIFKQIISINDSRAIRKVSPVRILDPFVTQGTRAKKLQYMLLRGNIFNPPRVAVPISWLINDSLTLCISLEDDFPFFIIPQSVEHSRMPSIAASLKSSNSLKVSSITEDSFFADVLMTRGTINVLFDSLYSQRLKLPVPGYVPQVNLGKTEVTGTREIDKLHQSDKTGSFIPVSRMKSDEPICEIKPSLQRISTAPPPDVREGGDLVNNIIRVLSKPFTVNKAKLSSIPSLSRYNSSEDVLNTLLPSVILSSTLVELTSSHKSQHTTLNPSSRTLKQYEVLLESCQIVENMIPLDLYMITPQMYKALNPKKGDEMDDVDVTFNEPLMIKAGGSAQLSSYMNNGRFLLKDLISKEVEFKLDKGDFSSTVSVVFEVMQPGLLNSTMNYIYHTTYDPDALRGLPRRMIISTDICKKSHEHIKDKSGYIKRCLDSSQIVCTVYADKWVVNWLSYPISICRSDGRFQQTIGAHSCSIVSQDLSSTQLQLAIWKSNLKSIYNFDSYAKKPKRRWLDFGYNAGTHAMSSKFQIPDLTFSTCSIKSTEEYPNLHYLISTCMAPVPFFRTGVLEILPQITLTNEFMDSIWIRESSSSKKIKSTDYPWHEIDPGLTVEFHSQTKGEFYIEVTGINPHTYEETTQAERLNYYSCSIALKSSSCIQFRYPTSVTSAQGSGSNSLHSKRPTLLSKNIKMEDDARYIKYGLCEIEAQMHRGAKLIRLMKPTSPDWIILNSTGLDLWVEQVGVAGYGEIVRFAHYSSDLTKHYSINSSPFSWYDPFKDQRLLCRLHMVQKLSLSDFTSSNAAFKRYRPSLEPSTNSLLYNRKTSRINERRGLYMVSIKGQLNIDLSCVRSVYNVAVCKIRYGRYTIILRLIAQSSIMFGQRTLNIMATRLSTRVGFDFKYLKGNNLFGLYDRLKKRKVTVDKSNRSIRMSTAKYSSTLKPFRHSMGLPARFSDGSNIKSELYRAKDSKIVQNTKISPNFDYILTAKILGLGVSLCAHMPLELSYFSCTLIKFVMSLENGEHKRKLSFGWIQSDVHDPSTCFPTMIRPINNYSIFYNRSNITASNNLPESDESSAGLNQPDVLNIVFNTRTNKYIKLKEITAFSLDLQPLSINIDTRIILSFLYLMDDYLSIFGFTETSSDYFVTPGFGTFSTENNTFESVQYPLQDIVKSRYASSAYAGTKYNISMLSVGRLVMVINIRHSGALSLANSSPVSPMIRYLVYIVRRTPYISDAHISLARESFLITCSTPYVLISHFVNRYITQGVQQIYKVLWAVDLIGNPKIVLNHWISGILQTFSVCYATLLKGSGWDNHIPPQPLPSDIRDALRFIHLPPLTCFLILKGIYTLVISVFSGIIESLYRATGSWYLLLNNLSCNSDSYAVLIMQDIFKRVVSQPSNIMEGMLFAGASIGKNLYISLGNFALKPIYSINKFVHSIKSESSNVKDVCVSGLRIFGSLFSSVLSLVFGVSSSVLSGTSLILQGLINQIHSVPMLSAVRPRRSLQLLKTPGPIRYNFVESWSMDVSKKIEDLDEVLLILPLDIKNRLFDPTYLTMSHWSVLTKDMTEISPLILSQAFSHFDNMLWVDRIKYGYIENGRVRWKCDNKDIISIEIYAIAPVHYGVVESEDANDGTIVLSVTNKIAKKHFGSKELYYMRIVHSGAYTTQSHKSEQSLPKDLHNKLCDSSSFIEAAEKKSKTFIDIGQINDIYKSHTYVDMLGAINQAYPEVIKDTPSDSIDNHDISPNGLHSKSKCDEKTTADDKISSCVMDEKSEFTVTIDDNKQDFDELVKQQSIEQTIAKRNIKRGHGHSAEIIQMPNIDTAKLYFTLLVTVLRGDEI